MSALPRPVLDRSTEPLIGRAFGRQRHRNIIPLPPEAGINRLVTGPKVRYA
jgi:hypothetical protein